jgi:hypothetical protein
MMRLGLVAATRSGVPLQFGHVLVSALALASLGAGVIHCSASPDHASLPVHAGFFVVVGTAQILWAPLILRRFSRRRLYLGAAGNLALVGIWLASRTTGLGFVPGAEHVEPVGFKDTVTVFLEVAVVAGVGLWALLPGRERRLASGRLAVGLIGVAVGLMMVAGVTAPSHEHDESKGELVATHPHGDQDQGDHQEDQPAVAHPAHGAQGEAGHGDEHALAPGLALAPGPGHGSGHHADHQRAGVARHGAHAHPDGDSVQGAAYSHEHASGPADEGHHHDADSTQEGDAHDHGQDDHGDHDHGGGSPVDALMTFIEETGKSLGL